RRGLPSSVKANVTTRNPLPTSEPVNLEVIGKVIVVGEAVLAQAGTTTTLPLIHLFGFHDQ
ncbi:hypothetical protein ABT126_45695, partial [Streptomyces sp. NPDC002012]|uniref:hypothetical protein n=1 Tax=Streptomyces sp. NPDC002012 TaxID=3154532 RepID=UPI003328B861